LAVSIIIWALSYFPHSTAIREQVKIEYAQELKKNATAEEDIKSAATISTKKVSPDEALALSPDPDLSSIEGDPIFERKVAAAQLENSYLGRIGKFMQPLFAPAGFDWRLTVAVISSFPARELVVTTLGILYNLGDGVSEKDSGLTAALRGAKNSDGTPLYTPLVAASLLIFMALSLQCVATIVTLIQEVNLKAALGSFVFMTVLAWSAAVVVYQVGSLF
jgi:ferrous iron transport protein B